MPTVLSYTNAFPGGPFPQHGSGQTTTVQNYLFPGAVQPLSTKPTVTSYTKAFPGGPFLQHGSGQTTTVQSYLYPGAVQPQIVAAAGRPPPSLLPMTGAGMIGPGPLLAGQALLALYRNRKIDRRAFLSLIGWSRED